MLDIEQLLTPVSEQEPCGEDIAFSAEVDAIAKARQADDPSIEQGAWVTSLKEADWKFVASRCAQLIEKRSKDLRLAVWLAEASAKTASFRGLGDSLQLVSALCERFWEHLHPMPDDGGHEQRIGNLCWIAGRLPQLMQELPVNEADGALAADTAYCAGAIAQLERVVDEKLGADGPGFSAARSALEGIIHSNALSTGDSGAATGTTAPAATQPMANTSQHAHGPIQTRSQAIAQLRLVADYFRRTEPHSPVAYLADKAAAWGDQPLHVWLRGVVKDDAAFAHIEELLGVQGR
ncbi:MAG TPA: type VI secretion system protein TssA [Telluria sp.]